MDGENNGSKPYEQMGWFRGIYPYFWVDTHMSFLLEKDHENSSLEVWRLMS